MDISFDIILIVIDFLPIHDTRNLLRCGRKLNLLRLNKNIALLIDINSLNWEKKLNYEIKSKVDRFFNVFYFFTIHDVANLICPMEKYTLEIICYGYDHLLLNRYILKYNRVFGQFNIMLFYVGYNNFLDLTKLLIYLGVINYYGSNNIIYGAAINGNLKILKYLKQHNCRFDYIEWRYAIMSRQLRVLKWVKNNGYYIDNHSFNYAIENKHWDILNWAVKNNLINTKQLLSEKV